MVKEADPERFSLIPRPLLRCETSVRSGLRLLTITQWDWELVVDAVAAKGVPKGKVECMVTPPPQSWLVEPTRTCAVGEGAFATAFGMAVGVCGHDAVPAGGTEVSDAAGVWSGLEVPCSVQSAGGVWGGTLMEEDKHSDCLVSLDIACLSVAERWEMHVIEGTQYT